MSAAVTMTFEEAEELLESIGYRQDWTTQELIAAVPFDMAERFATALEVSAAEYAARADALITYGEAKWPNVRFFRAKRGDSDVR